MYMFTCTANAKIAEKSEWLGDVTSYLHNTYMFYCTCTAAN